MAWTILFTDEDGNNIWQQFDRKSDLIEYMEFEGIADYAPKDVQIYPPRIEEFLMGMDEVL